MTGGSGNTAGGSPESWGDTVGGGTGNFADGNWATVPGGRDNSAGASSFAAGTRAKAINGGSFVWGDATDADVTDAGWNTFVVRATGGAFFSSGLTAGSFFGDGSGLSNVNAANLGSVAAANFARRDAANSFSNNQFFNDSVGIGTNSPGEKLHVSGGGIRVDFDGTDVVPFVKGLSVNMDQNNGRAGLALHTSGSGVAYLGYSSAILDGKSMLILGTVNSSHDIGFFTNLGAEPNIDNLDISGKDPVMLINGTGNVGIGTSAPSNILTIVQDSATDPIADSWATYSSRRWKTNIQTLQGALDKVERLRGVSYDAKADGQHHIGLIAEEVGEVVPEVVAYEANGQDAKSVDYARLTALLIEAVKEQRAEIRELKAHVGRLTAELAGRVEIAQK